MTDLDIAQDLGARAYQYSAADFWMAVAGLFPGTAERHAMQHRNVVLDHRSLADHQARGMVEEDAAPDAGIGMNVALEDGGGAALQIEREIHAPFAPQPMRQPMRLDGMEALVIKHRLEQAVGGGVAIERGYDVGAKGRADRGLVFERIEIGPANQLGRHL